MRIPKLWTLVVGLALPHVATAQPPLCADILAQPTRDSTTEEVEVLVRAFDATHEFPVSYSRLFGEGIRQYFTLQAPLTLDTYYGGQAFKRTARNTNLVTRGAYRADLTPDAHIQNARVVGGTHSSAIDRAVLAALATIDTSGALPPAPESVTGGKTVQVVIVVRSYNSERDSVIVGPFAARGVPLFSYRTPVRRIDRPVQQVPRKGNLRYPDELRSRRVEGDVTLSFVVSPDSTAVLSTAQAEAATDVAFVGAAVTALPAMRFHPLELEGGCPVRALVQQPFQFRLAP